MQLLVNTFSLESFYVVFYHRSNRKLKILKLYVCKFCLKICGSGCWKIMMQNYRDIQRDKKTCQSIIFEKNNSAKFTKISIKPLSRTASPNLKSYFCYSYTNCPQINIEVLKKWQKSIVRFYD